MSAVLRTLDEYIETFEQARMNTDEVDLGEFLPAPEDSLYQPVLRELIRIDLEFGWESHRPTSLDDYAQRFPTLFLDPDSVKEIAFEEFRLRRQAGESPTPQEYAERYGIDTQGWPESRHPSTNQVSADTSFQLERAAHSYKAFRSDSDLSQSFNLEGWKKPEGVSDEVMKVFYDLHAKNQHLADQFSDGLISMPKPGSDFLGFHLIRELGRGAFGRVFLANQSTLADRPVALKVAPDVGFESNTLAQLQHTHIVPIYSVHHNGPLSAVCMPFCGTVTVGDILRELATRSQPATKGAALLQVIESRRAEGAPPLLCSHIEERSFPEAVLWMVGKLADALHHAHERGILHRDIKPANILITDEGLPMLLDFNVANDTKQTGLSEAMVGGTLPYMAPEQLGAFTGQMGTVDARADVYSLGVVLFELLTGRFPFTPVRLGNTSAAELNRVVGTMLAERRQTVPCPRQFNPQISASVAAIVRKSLEPDLQQRYPSAEALKEDIDRHLQNQPLKYAKEPDLRERIHKWIKRNPGIRLRLSLVTLALVVTVALVLGRQYRNALNVQAAVETRKQFERQFAAAQFKLITQPLTTTQCEEGRSDGLRALEQYRVLNDADWQKQSLVTSLQAKDQKALKETVGELLLVLARSLIRYEVSPTSEQLRQALRYNQIAQTCFEVGDEPPLLWEQRGILHERLGEKVKAENARSKAKEMPVTKPRDRYLAAADFASRQEFFQARSLLLPAVTQERDNYWFNYLLGLSHHGLGDKFRAYACYSVCIGLRPELAGAYLNRSFLSGEMNDFGAAVIDLDVAIKLVPENTEAYMDRALFHARMKRFKEALADLDTAIEKGCPLTRIYFIRSRIRQQTGDKVGAEADLKEGLKRKPQDELSWIARSIACMTKEPRKALEDLDEALKLNPRSRAALRNKAHIFAELINEPNKAIVVLKQLLKIYPFHTPSLAGLAVVQARLGQRTEAHDNIEKALAQEETDLVRYQAGCVYALTSTLKSNDAVIALKHLRQSIRASFGLDYIAYDKDPDLKPLRGRPDYQALQEAARLLLKQVR